jgi:hypothetical protein
VDALLLLFEFVTGDKKVMEEESNTSGGRGTSEGDAYRRPATVETAASTAVVLADDK